MARRFSSKVVRIPRHDCDVMLQFPGGKTVLIQCRPSNADQDYAGSLDIILPEDQCVTNWAGDDMAAAPAVSKNRQHERRAKQIVMELPMPRP